MDIGLAEIGLAALPRQRDAAGCGIGLGAGAEPGNADADLAVGVHCGGITQRACIGRTGIENAQPVMVEFADCAERVGGLGFIIQLEAAADRQVLAPGADQGIVRPYHEPLVATGDLGGAGSAARGGIDLGIFGIEGQPVITDRQDRAAAEHAPVRGAVEQMVEIGAVGHRGIDLFAQPQHRVHGELRAEGLILISVAEIVVEAQPARHRVVLPRNHQAGCPDRFAANQRRAQADTRDIAGEQHPPLDLGQHQPANADEVSKAPAHDIAHWPRQLADVDAFDEAFHDLEPHRAAIAEMLRRQGDAGQNVASAGIARLHPAGGGVEFGNRDGAHGEPAALGDDRGGGRGRRIGGGAHPLDDHAANPDAEVLGPRRRGRA